MLLTGSFPRSLDEKLRLAIPKRLREILGGTEMVSLYVAPGTDGSLTIYTEAAFNQLAQRLAQSSPTQQDVRAFSRLFFAQAQRVELDAQGRVRLPPELAQAARLTKETVLIGVQDHMELWDKKRWDEYLAVNSGRYDEIAERAFAPSAGPAK